MKLFIWTGVLSDYTDGMAVALAPDLESALKALEEVAGYSLDLPVSDLTIIDPADNVAPRGWYVYGGG